MSTSLSVKVNAIEDLTPRIRSLELVPAEGQGDLPAFTAGSHLAVKLKSGLERQYSLSNDSGEYNRYVIAVQREDAGRGGSIEMHDVRVGDVLSIGIPRNNFPLAPDAARHLLIAGGIGITPILAMARTLQRQGKPFQLIYLTRSRAEMAFGEVLQQEAFAKHVILHHDEEAGAMFDLVGALGNPGSNEHVYCCGPSGLMAAVAKVSSGWAEGAVHFEHFTNETPAAAEGDQAFQVTLAKTGTVVDVRADQTILDALLERGIDVDYSCQEGTCGTCITKVIEGVPDHRDSVLMESEKANSITICCSRAKTSSLTLDL